jgi:putative membrane protein
MTREKIYPTLWLTIFLAVFIWSVIEPPDYFTWFLEVFPAMIALVILVSTYRWFNLLISFTGSSWSLLLS